MSAEQRERLFGHPENIEKRLATWANQLSTNKSYPWVGTGLIDDLVRASIMLGGNPGKTFPDTLGKEAGTYRESARAPQPQQEYDL